MNSYNLTHKEDYSYIVFHAVAENEEHVRELAKSQRFDISDCNIELERKNVKNELGHSIKPFIIQE